jgi:hypothetical protein
MHPNRCNFCEGLELLLRAWPALCLAIEQQWAGPDTPAKLPWLRDALAEHFDAEGPKVEVFDLEDILRDVLIREFACILEDDSECTVARDIHRLYRDCVTGGSARLEELRHMASQKRSPQFSFVESTGQSDSEANTCGEEEDGEDYVDDDQINE